MNKPEFAESFKAIAKALEISNGRSPDRSPAPAGGVFKLNSKQKTRLLEGKAEYKAGKVLSEKEANKQIAEWFTK